jgi:hypothetical protein
MTVSTSSPPRLRKTQSKTMKGFLQVVTNFVGMRLTDRKSERLLAYRLTLAISGFSSKTVELLLIAWKFYIIPVGFSHLDYIFVVTTST